MTATRFIDFKANAGEEITGMGLMFDRVNVFMTNSIHEIDFTVLNLSSLSGDQSVSELVRGFGLIAPRSLQNTGQFYVLAAQDGIRL